MIVSLGYTHHRTTRARVRARAVYARVCALSACAPRSPPMCPIYEDLYILQHVNTTRVLRVHEGVCRCLSHVYQRTCVRALTVRRCTWCVRVRFPLRTAVDGTRTDG